MEFSFSWDWGWSPRSPKTHFSILLSVSIVTGFLALTLYFHTLKHLSNSMVTEGVVVESEISTHGMHTLIVEFQDENGKTVQFVTEGSANNPELQKYFDGDTVKVIISAETGKPKLLNFFKVYGITLFLAMFSLAYLVGSLGIYFLMVRNAPDV